jgi:hypothetical protein
MPSAAQPGEDLALGQRHILHRAEAFEVGALGVVHQRHVGTREARQVVDLAGMVHAHLDHRGAMAWRAAQQHQRQADVVVEVALRRQHAPRSPRRQNARAGWRRTFP